ncbi:MAG TPA: HDIG domain-containing protein [Fredinandcohnia sp.]|nr:HDIG domain-containing protein [Fredinandcohnia sp.]
MREKRPGSRIVVAVVVAAIGAAAAYVFAPSALWETFPFERAELGAVAPVTLVADRDYDVLDEATTRRMREEAVAAVRAVYVHDATAIDSITSRIRQGFAFARSLLEAGDAGLLDAEREALERLLGARLENRELETLAANGFSREVEEGVVALVTQVMRELIVSDREELAQHRSRGIAIRRKGRDREAVEILSDVEGIRDLATVRAQLNPEVPELAGQSRAVRQAALELARREIRSNLHYDPDLTQKRREEAASAIKPVVVRLKKGDPILRAGERIEERHLVVLRGLQSQADAGLRRFGWLGGMAVALVLALGLVGLGRSAMRRVRRRDLFVLGLLAVLLLLGAESWFRAGAALRAGLPEIPLRAWFHLFPFAAVPLVLRMVMGAQVALVFSTGLSLLVGLAAEDSLAVALVSFVGSLFAAERAGAVRDRAGLFRAGAMAGSAQALTVVALALVGGEFAVWEILAAAAGALLGGAVAVPIVALVLLSLLESGLGYLSDLRLIELSSLNHPALKELIVQAPGTYHHSIIVGSLVEAAAVEIGANPLLAKVCAYYHDLGKGKNPLYFAENQKGSNPHDALPPEESAQIVIRHVQDGLAIARKHKLPRLVADAIPQHHGTRLVAAFYHRAVRDGAEVDPLRFRYPGPRPQHKEHALVMLADSVEAASRSLADGSPERIRELVHTLVQRIVAEGELSECPITLEDLSKIEKSFCKTLEAIYHARPSYPTEGPSVEAGAEAPVVSLRR